MSFFIPCVGQRSFYQYLFCFVCSSFSFFGLFSLLRLCMLLFLSRASIISLRPFQSAENIYSDVNYSPRPCAPLLVFVTCFLFSNYHLLCLRLNSCEALFFYCEAAAVARSVCEAVLTIAKRFSCCEAQPVLAKQSSFTILAKRRMKLRSRFICAKLSFHRSRAFAKSSFNCEAIYLSFSEARGFAFFMRSGSSSSFIRDSLTPVVKC